MYPPNESQEYKKPNLTPKNMHQPKMNNKSNLNDPPKSKNPQEVHDNSKIEISCENANIDRGIITEDSNIQFILLRVNFILDFIYNMDLSVDKT
jgi:hypothetical protein